MSAAESTCALGSIVNIEKPTGSVASMSSVVFRWSASAPVPSRQPSANMPQVASSITSIGVRCVRAISRIDCCGKIGAIAPPTARTARTWPGVARPRRSPRPAEVLVPSGRGRSHSKRERSAAAFLGESGPTSTPELASPSNAARPARLAGRRDGEAMAFRVPHQRELGGAVPHLRSLDELQVELAQGSTHDPPSSGIGRRRQA